MRRSFLGLALAAAVVVSGSANPGVLVYQVQLVRGTDSASPPTADSHKVAPALAHSFQNVFKWKHYWLIRSQQIRVALGQKQRTRFDSDREVEIDLTDPAKRTVAAFDRGRVVERTICPRGPTMTLIGRDRDQVSAWFIVVRPESPK